MDAEFIAYVDYLALVARSKYNYELEDKLSKGAETVRDWLLLNGLQLATEKSEVIIFTRTITHNEIVVTVGNSVFHGYNSIKYLGITLDMKLNFTAHASCPAIKAGRVVSNLTRNPSKH